MSSGAIRSWSTWFATDRVPEALGFQVLVHVRQGERRIAAQQAAQDLAAIPRDHRVEHVAPSVSTVHVTGPQGTPLHVAVLVEHEERVIAGAGEVAVVRRRFLRAVRRAHAAVDVEHECRPRPPCLHAIDPPPREIGQRREVLLLGHRARLEATHLARGRGVVRHRAPADDPAHRGITPEAVRIVHVLVPGEAAEHGLAELREQRVAPVLAAARIVKRVGGQRRQAEGVVEFAEREQAGVGGDRGAVEFELQATVEIEPETVVLAFTRRDRPSAAPP